MLYADSKKRNLIEGQEMQNGVENEVAAALCKVTAPPITTITELNHAHFYSEGGFAKQMNWSFSKLFFMFLTYWHNSYRSFTLSSRCNHPDRPHNGSLNFV